jgi:phage gp46-like protein
MIMNNLHDFEGDLLLFETLDGGEIKIENDLFASDRSFNTAVYLSLFGGNKDDNGKVKNNKTWWANTLPAITENEKLVSRFQAITAGYPMTTKTIREAEAAARLDLKWLVDEGIADKISASGSAAGRNKFNLYVYIEARGKSIYENTFSLFWRAGVYGGRI